MSWRARYVMGIDMAPAQRKTADDGAMVILRARPRPELETPSNIPSDWLADFVWGYRVRGAEIGQWSGLVHEKHRDFGLSGIMLDPQAGGQYLELELEKEKQIINGAETLCVPIASIENTARCPTGQYILIMFRRRQPLIQRLWGTLAGDDLLYDRAHVAFQQAVSKAQVRFPKAYDDRPKEETESWSEEKQWALKCVDTVRTQLVDVQVATLENGMYAVTGNGARQFSSSGRKDFAYAGMFAWLRFFLWLTVGEHDEDGDGGDEEACSVF